MQRIKISKIGLIALGITLCACGPNHKGEKEKLPGKDKVFMISREVYQDQLEGFWLGQSIANWTGLVTEMDKIGNIGDQKTGPFYTREDWGAADQANIWSDGVPSDLSPTIDFVLRDSSEIWGADDDTDIEYMYQHLLLSNETSFLTGEQIRQGWLEHIHQEEENFLWVSNQRAFDLMQEGVVPPETSAPENNEHFEMIDAQLTTEIFGLFAPTRPDIALKMADLSIRTTARDEAAEIAGFYVVMHASVYLTDPSESQKSRIFQMAEWARENLQDQAYPAKMYDRVWQWYTDGLSWEQTRDSIYVAYQVEQRDGYNMTERALPCNACFAAGINYAASLVSLFYGEGDYKQTVKIGALTGWDSDNPTATWGGLIGFMMGREALEAEFEQSLSNRFNIHRTRKNFPNQGLDRFDLMAERGLKIVDKVVTEEMQGRLDQAQDQWILPIQGKN